MTTLTERREGTEYETSQLAPHSQAAEAALLGSVLITPSQFKGIASYLKCDDFFLLHHNWIWEVMTIIQERGEDITTISVADELRNQNRIEDIPTGSAYLLKLGFEVRASLNAGTYGQIVKRASIRRHILEASNDIERIAREETSDIHAMLAAVQERIAKATAVNISRQEPTMADINDRRRQNQTETVGFDWFLKCLTSTIGKLSVGDFHMIGALTGIGKSRFCVQQCVHLLDLKERFRMVLKMLEDKSTKTFEEYYVNDSPKRVLFLTTEMFDYQIASVFMEMITKTGYSVRKEKDGLKSDSSIEDRLIADEILAMEVALENTPLEIVEAVGWTVEQVISRINEQPPGTYNLVVVDQITSLEESAVKTEMRSDQELSRRSRKLKNVAHEAQTVILSPTQFNGENSHTIQNVQNIRGSKAIGDFVVSLLSIRKPDEQNYPTQAEISISKIRASSGTGKKLNVSWDKLTGTFHDLTLREQHQQEKYE